MSRASIHAKVEPKPMAGKMKIAINNEIELKQIDMVYAEEFFLLIEENRKYLRQWLAWLDVTKTVDDTKSFIARTLESIQNEQSRSYFIFKNSKIAGIIHLVGIDHLNKKAMIGYWVGEKFRGGGIAKKATQAILDLAFENLKLNRIEIRCATGNLASQAIPKSLGFKEEGLLRENEWLYDHFVDHVVYSKLRSDRG